SAWCAIGTSSTTCAWPCDLLPTRMISPLRTNHKVPCTSRSRVVRRPTASTVPEASPTSMTSPTPYWSSSSMKMPDRKSLTRFCAPKPNATPAIPAVARIGARLMPSSLRTSIDVSPSMVNETMLRRIEAMVSARCRRRSDSSVVCSSTALARSRSGRSRAGAVTPLTWVSRVIVRLTNPRRTRATSTISRIRAGLPPRTSKCSSSQRGLVRTANPGTGVRLACQTAVLPVELGGEEGELVGGQADRPADRPRPVPDLGLPAQQHRPLGPPADRVLQRGAHLPAVQRIHPGVGVERGEQHSRVPHAGPDVVVRRVAEQPAQLGGVARGAVLVVPGPAQPELLVPDHVQQRRAADHRAVQLGPLGERGADQQAAVGAAEDAQPLRRGQPGG